MKRIALIAINMALALSISTTTLGADYSSNIIINDNNLKLGEIQKSEKEQIMLPLRLISEQLNYLVKWNNKDRSIELSTEQETFSLKIGQSKVKVGKKEIDLDTSISMKNGKTLVPIEFFDRVLNLKLAWNDKEKTFRINEPRENLEKQFEIDEDEIIRNKVDNYMKSLVEYQNFSGSLLIGKEDKLILDKGYGYSNVEQHITNKPQTKFAIGSMTKQFTAMSIMQLSEKKLLNVDDKVSKYIPELKEAEKITIQNLLTHTSGLKNYTDLIGFFNANTKNKNPMAMIELINDMPLEFKPGEMFKYSNTNYLLLGMIVEKVTEKSLEDYLKENILYPLNMKDTGTIYGKNNQAPDATPYSGFIEVESIDDSLVLSQAFGAGNMYSTVEDLYRWDRALKTEKLVNKETMEEIFKSHIMFSEVDGYGYGWMIGDTDSGKKVGHGGNTLGFSSNIDRYVDKDLTIITLTNKGYYDVVGLSDNLKNIALGNKYNPVDELKEIEIKDKKIYEKYVGKYKLFEGTNITVTYENDKLYAQVTGQPSFQIFPQTESKFFAKIVAVSIDFISDDKGVVGKLNIEQMGQQFSCEKITEEKLEKPEQVE